MEAVIRFNYDGQIKGMYGAICEGTYRKKVSMKDAEDSEDKNTEDKTWKSVDPYVH